MLHKELCRGEPECADGCKCCPCAATSDEPVCGEKRHNVVLFHHALQPHEHAIEMMEHIAGLMAGKAAAEASLERGAKPTSGWPR